MGSTAPVISMDTLVVRSANAAGAEVDGQLVALDITKGVCFGLNRVATVIWSNIDKPTSSNTIVALLLDQYEIDEPTCAAQTLELMSDLVVSGLAQVA